MAEATGRCEIRPNCYVHQIATDKNGRATGVVYFDAKRNTHLQRAKAVIVCANGAETPRLLLAFRRRRNFPNGLANSSGMVGKNLMPNSGAIAFGVFDEPLNDYKGFAVSRVLHDFYEMDPKKVGFYGGGGLDARFDFTPGAFAMSGLPPGTPKWGKEFKKALHQNFTRTLEIFCHATSLARGDEQFLARSRREGCLGIAGAAHDVPRPSQRFENDGVDEGSRHGDSGCGGREDEMACTRLRSSNLPYTCWAPAAWATTPKRR